MMQQLECFQYNTASNMNTRYYNIDILYHSKCMKTIVTEFVNLVTILSQWACEYQGVYFRLEYTNSL